MKSFLQLTILCPGCNIVQNRTIFVILLLEETTLYKKIWATLPLFKSAYNKCMDSVCFRYDLTRMELAVLLFLANNPQYDTASDIVEKRRFTKSHVSTTVKSLESRGFILREYRGNNRKTAHLKLCGGAVEIAAAGQAAQKKFGDLLFLNFSDEEKEHARQLFCNVIQNMENFLSEDSDL